MKENPPISTSKAVIEYLVEQFPECFKLEGDSRPLKIGIFDDLIKRCEDDERLSKTKLRSALRLYTSSWRYLRSVKAGVQRVDLDGKDAGLVDQEHQEHAQQLLQESQARVKEKKAQHVAKSKLDASKARKHKSTESARSNHQGKPESKPLQRRPKQSQPQQRGTKVAAKPLVSVGSVFVGDSVQVKVGRLPVSGIIVGLERSEAQVQLQSGMTVRVPVADLFRA